MAQRVYREKAICSDKGHDGLLPISSATLWRWVKEGKFPQPFKLGPRITVWDAEEVDAFLKAQRAQREAAHA